MTTPITDPAALADQIDAGARDARRVLHAMAAAGRVSPIDAGGNPWLAEQAAALVAALTGGTGRACAHLGPAPSVVHAAVWAPGRIVCPACIPALRPSPIEGATCDRCRRHARRLHAGAAAIGPVILAYGLCRSCATATGLTPASDQDPSYPAQPDAPRHTGATRRRNGRWNVTGPPAAKRPR